MVEKPPIGTRLEIGLLTTVGVFRAGIRTYRGDRKEVYVCPKRKQLFESLGLID